MIVLFVVLCFNIRAYQASPLYVEIHHRDPQTGEVLRTTEMEIESDMLNNENTQPQISSPVQDDNQAAALEYYYGCSMPLPPPIERSNLINDVKEIESVADKSNTSYNVREPNSATDSVVNSTIGTINGLALQLLSFGFGAFYRFAQ